jgi:predicted transcriptional regulator
MLPEITELNRIRLDEDLTFSELAALVGLKDGSSMHRLIREGRQPQERTLYRIRKFITSRRKSGRRKAVA